ncbi:MAG: glutamate synthase-related protein [Candidatus Limnocylindrales bacterium]
MRSGAAPSSSAAYRRYWIPTQLTPEVVRLPPRFRVRVKRHRLAMLAVQEVLAARGDLRVALSRPCVYGVFGRPVGGMAPIEDDCVGCLRCTIEYPGVVQITRNDERHTAGPAGVSVDEIDTILYEARTGRVPVRGAGFRGPFGGTGWDGIWLDMSEIVRPTRDGIHGREYISTVVDLGDRPAFLRLDEAGLPVPPLPRGRQIQVPFILGAAPSRGAATTERRSTAVVQSALVETARRIDSLALVPLDAVIAHEFAASHVLPLVSPDKLDGLDRLASQPAMIELERWDAKQCRGIIRRLPETVVSVRVPLGSDVLALIGEGIRVFHLVARPMTASDRASLPDLIQRTHQQLVEAGIRDEVTLIGSGGIEIAEHVPKALACGLDAVVLDNPLWVALQARFALDRAGADPHVTFPSCGSDWAVQRLLNLAAAWRDQLLEILGAMGLREVRRLRGELGRCLFQSDLEREAFGGIDGSPG